MTAWLGLDVGGTFTDLAYIDSDGILTCRKVPSTPSSPGQSTLDGVDELVSSLDLDVETRAGLHHVHSSTLATNTLIERRGATIGLITTAGFRDLLELQRLWVPNAQQYDSQRVVPLVPRSLVREVEGRMNPQGQEVRPLDDEGLLRAAKELVEAGVEGIVICFLHSFRNPAHEDRAAGLIRERWSELLVTTSSSVWPQAREFERATLATINLYVRPQIQDYIGKLTSGLQDRKVATDAFVARSNGGAELADTVSARPVVVVLSGPAAGVSGAARAAEEAGWSGADLITVDVGGTSADIGVIRGGQPVLSSEEHIADFPVLIPTVAVSSIGAGGGSRVWTDDAGSVRIGPRSLGADPGPACYGRQAETPALTDAFVAAGWLGDDRVLGGSIRLDVDASRRALATLSSPLASTPDELADAAIWIGVAMMAAETMRVLARRGVDAPTFRMVAFGGAGPLLGALLADEVRIDSVLIPPTPGALSAFGAATSAVEGDMVEPVYGLVADLDGDWVSSRSAALEAQAEKWLSGVAPAAILSGRSLAWSADMRYDGQGYDVTVPLEAEWLSAYDANAITEAFHRAHELTYGHFTRDRGIWMKELRVHVTGRVHQPTSIVMGAADNPPPSQRRTIRLRGQQIEVDVLHRDLVPANGMEGPAIIEQLDTTTLVPPGWRVDTTPSGSLILNRIRTAPTEE